MTTSVTETSARFYVERVEWDALLKSAGDASEEAARLRAKLTAAERRLAEAETRADISRNDVGRSEAMRAVAERERDEALARAAPSADAAAQVRAGLEAAAALLEAQAREEDAACERAQRQRDREAEVRAAIRESALLQARDAVRGLDAAEIVGRG